MAEETIGEGVIEVRGDQEQPGEPANDVARGVWCVTARPLPASLEEGVKRQREGQDDLADLGFPVQPYAPSGM